MASLLDQTKEKMSSVFQKANEFVFAEKGDLIAEFKDAGMEKVNAMLDEINGLSTNIKHAGYDLTEIISSLGLPPSFSLTFHFLEEISGEAREKVLDEFKDKKLSTLILKCLFKAGDYANAVKMGSYKLREVNIELGLLPAVSMKFVKN